LDSEISVQVFDANKNEIDEQIYIDQIIKDSFVQFTNKSSNGNSILNLQLVNQFKDPFLF